MTKSQLLCQIRSYAFALLELNLYLDTHPCDTAALAKMAEFRAEKERLIALYEAQFGPYILTVKDAQNECCFAWINSPWPWEYERGE